MLGLRVGDPHDEVLGAWPAKESVRDVYLTDEVEEIRSLGRTLWSWRKEILEHHRTGASNGPTEGHNLLIKKVKRCGHGYRKFENYRLRVLLHAGGVTWPDRPTAPRLRTRSPHSNA